MSIGSSAGRLLVPVAVALVFALSRRYLPVSSKLSFTERDAKEFSRLQWVVGAAMLSVGCVFGLLSYKALLWANAAMAGRDPSRHFLILPGHWIWFFLPFFGAICLAWEITLRLWRLLGDPVQARKYESWSNFKAGFNATRVLQIMIVTMEVPIAIATLLALPIHTSIDDAGLSVGHFGTLHSTRYRYSDVTKITVTEGLRLRDGSLQKRPAITLDFGNGTRWSSADNRDPEKSIDESLLNFLEEKTHLSAAHLDAFPFGSA